MSWLQNRIDTVKTPIHDQYLWDVMLFIIGTPGIIYKNSEVVPQCYIADVYLLKSTKAQSLYSDYLHHYAKKLNYCFLGSSSANTSINACCCGVSFQDAGTTVAGALRPLWPLSRCWHICFTEAVRTVTAIFNPNISRPGEQQPPKTRRRRERPPARLYAWAQDPFAVLHFLKALLTSYNRHRLSFRTKQLVQLIICWDKS